MQKSFLTTAEEEEIDQQEKNQSGHNYFPIRDGMKEAKKWLQKNPLRGWGLRCTGILARKNTQQTPYKA
jgi:hypothetical protein